MEKYLDHFIQPPAQDMIEGWTDGVRFWSVKYLSALNPVNILPEKSFDLIRFVGLMPRSSLNKVYPVCLFLRI